MVTSDEVQEMQMSQLKLCFNDSFLGTVQQTTAVTQTGYITQRLADVQLSTGIQQASTARMNYGSPIFNPLYGKLYIRARASSMHNLFMFFGFKENLDTPTFDMTDSHAGIMISQADDPGVPYWSTGNGALVSPRQQRTPIPHMDMTRWLIYRMQGHRFSFYSLPFTVPYFEENVVPKIVDGMVRKWSQPYANGSVWPEDKVHYIMFYVRNTTGEDVTLNLGRVNYAEVYPD